MYHLADSANGCICIERRITLHCRLLFNDRSLFSLILVGNTLYLLSRSSSCKLKFSVKHQSQRYNHRILIIEAKGTTKWQIIKLNSKSKLPFVLFLTKLYSQILEYRRNKSSSSNSFNASPVQPREINFESI